ncbi:glycosyltransferase [Flammeovirga sp. SubArs3]|uniref:glycosyltransferase n=1 Tax=Flammeovirga sp. SubArs3 TaxID=2995316 RepID=UPI00248CB513|nr:glycosyltransferase [Flammeovirga sp. SubArs3]
MDLWATQPTETYKYHGGAEYAKYIFYASINEGITDFDVFYNVNFEIDQDLLNKCKENSIRIHEVNDKADLYKLLKKNKYSRFYSAMPYHYDDYNEPNTKFILTVHGLRQLELPNDKYEYIYRPSIFENLKIYIRQHFFQSFKQKGIYHKTNKLLSIPNSEIVVVSNHTKFSLKTFFPKVDLDKISVLYSPSDLSYVKKGEINNREYFLLVSANRWEKNAYRALRALDDLFENDILINKKVIVIGDKNKVLLKNLKNQDRFIFKGYVEEDEYQSLFKNAFCFIYPTLNEGFGYPPLNAMRYGVPVIASAISAVTEVCESAVCYFNPYSINEIQNRIIQLSYDYKLRKELIDNGYRQLDKLNLIQQTAVNKILKIIFGK